MVTIFVNCTYRNNPTHISGKSNTVGSFIAGGKNDNTSFSVSPISTGIGYFINYIVILSAAP